MAAVDAKQPAQVEITTNSSISAEGYDNKCIFCKIVNKEMGTELLHWVRTFLCLILCPYVASQLV